MAYFYSSSGVQNRVGCGSTLTTCAASQPLQNLMSQCAAPQQFMTAPPIVNRISSMPMTTATALPGAAPSRTISYTASQACGGGTNVGVGLGVTPGVITLEKGGLCGTSAAGSNGCGTATVPGFSAKIGGYNGVPSMNYCTINSNEFSPYRISSGTYSAITINGVNTNLSNGTGLQILSTITYQCGLSQGSITQFSTHWMQIGSIFYISGIGGLVINPTNGGSAPGTTGLVGNIPYPQLLISLPVTTTITTCATMSGIVRATTLAYPQGQPFSNTLTVQPDLLSEFPVFYSLRYGCTSDNTSAGILLTIVAPAGLNGGSTPQNPQGLMNDPKNKTYCIIFQFNLAVDLGANS
jgi:hypothetical protein